MNRLCVPFLVALLAPATALPCGGLFCNVQQLQPVEQNAERILFEIHGDGTISSTVEIRYSGDAEDFSWVVPVPDTPELGLVPAQALRVLDDATAPSVNNQPFFCGEEGFAGCNAAGATPFGGTPAAGPRDAPAPRLRSLESAWTGDERATRPHRLAPGSIAGAATALTGCAESSLVANRGDIGFDAVEVEELPRVGPFESEVVSSNDPAELINWLNNNGYLITPAMEPMVSDYVVQGMKFLAMKLTPGADVSDIAPIRFTYPGSRPMIPLVLTAVSAEPEMGVMAFIAADGRFQAEGHANVLIDPYDVRADPTTGRTNYYPLVSWLVDELGGHAFITEHADDLSVARDLGVSRIDQGFYFSTSDATQQDFQDTSAWLTDLGSRATYLTRMYTRLSGWEMTIDPRFEPSAGGAVPSPLDLSENPPVDTCASFDDVACGDLYCGRDATCASTEGGVPGCVCPEGYAARVIAEPQLAGRPLIDRVICQAQTFDLMGQVDFTGSKGGDPCLDTECGAGQCVAINGFPTCECDGGHAAIASVDGPRCVGVIDEYAPESIVRRTEREIAAADKRDGRRHGADALALALLIGLPLVVRRARR